MNAIVLLPILSLFCDSFRGRANLQLELLALRHQLAMVKPPIHLAAIGNHTALVTFLRD